MSTAELLGHDRVGLGPRLVIVLNDWMCDTSTWDGARAYLDRERFSWVFTDLRGYGRSRGRAGRFDVVEAAGDVLALADALGCRTFALVAHSMSTLVAVHLAQESADRVERVVLVTPPPPGGFGADDAAIAAAQSLARSDEATRRAVLVARFGQRLSPGWAATKAARWCETADPEASAAYVRMFMRDGVPSPNARIAVPVLAITGEQDVPPMRRDAVVESFSPLCGSFEIVALADSGHYPMQEMPPLTVAAVERFLASDASSVPV